MSQPQLIIPMSGLGKRFIQAGYSLPKPLILVRGKPIIEHVLHMYPAWDDIIFVVNENHLRDPVLRLEETLTRLSPKSKIRAINSHDQGPSFAVLQAQDLIDKERPIVVSYCDFSGKFDLKELEKELASNDATLLTYSGFHPHMLRSTRFAYIKKFSNGHVSDIQEKNSYTIDPMREEASAGAYGFKSGKILIEAIREQITNKYSLNGEFYTSLTIRPILENRGRVSSILMENFYQWGTPEDLADFNYWTDSISHIDDSPIVISNDAKQSTIILLAGKGQRVAEHSAVPKPAITVNGKQLWKMGLRAGIPATESVMVIRDETLPFIERYESMKLVLLNEPTNGQADSARLGLESSTDGLELMVNILASDNVLPNNFSHSVLELMRREDFDIVVWTSVNYPPAQLAPEHFSWVKVSSSLVQESLFKTAPPSADQEWQVITGNFTFKSRAQVLNLVTELLLNENLKINKEFYLDSIIPLAMKKGIKVGALVVPNYFSLGTVDELQTFNYWNEVLKEDFDLAPLGLI